VFGLRVSSFALPLAGVVWLVWHSARVSGSESQRPSYDDLVARLVELDARLVERDAVVAVLLAEVAELRRRLGMDSSNSSKPPSSDGLDRQRRSGSGSGKRGKPRGAPGATRMLVDDPDERIPCRPTSCGGCGDDLGAAGVFASQRRQVVEVLPPPKPFVSEYLVQSLLCGGCGEVTGGDAPDGVAGRLQYGPGAKARMVYLRGAQYLPYGRAAHAMDVLCALSVAPATILAAVRDAADRLGPFVDRVQMLLRAQPVIGADETPAWVNGGWKYVHVACTEKLTLLHAGSRSKMDIDAGGVLAGFTGVLVRDGYAGYDHITTATHAECGAHLLRALKGVHESDPAAQQWAEAMANTLLIAKKWMTEAAAAGRHTLDGEQVGFIRSAYAGALASGREATAKHPGSKAAKLLRRFTRDADDILRFTTDTAIWFSNNQSERDLRPTKLQLKISATWRSPQGLADFATLRSYLSTATKHGQDLLDVLTALFTTGPWLPPDPAANPS
jgi:transposase